MTYELWNRESANLIGVFDSQDEALEEVRQAIQQGGNEPDSWTLGVEDGGTFRLVAAGAELISLAKKTVTA